MAREGFLLSVNLFVIGQELFLILYLSMDGLEGL